MKPNNGFSPRQTIATKYHGPTNTRGSRISARTSSGIRISRSYDHALNSDENHTAVAEALAEKLNWTGPWVPGCTPDGYVFVQLPWDYVKAVSAVFAVRRAMREGHMAGNPFCKDWGRAVADLTDAGGYADGGSYGAFSQAFKG